MKKIVVFITVVAWVSFSACSVGRGCPSNGKNVGAEKILSGDAKAIKAAKKAGKFKA